MALAPTLYDFQIALSHVDRAIDLLGDHIYAECDGQSFDGPLTRATL